eukprot:TRINITY_DN720_c0_g1_i1.p1 TRINITY_DN720_c0_g1~~TRINITY_DN720_c0_g1_i1.p1  ORF type:complete len:526 (-),score=118.22 TRINITY_DN720_c0_g1_i1:149-1726(-)
MVCHGTVSRRSCGGAWVCLSCLVVFCFGPELRTEQAWGVQSRLHPSFVAPVGATAKATSRKRLDSNLPRRQVGSTVGAASSTAGLAGFVSVALGLSLAAAAVATKRRAGLRLKAEGESCKGDASITGARATNTNAKAAEAAQRERERAELHSMLEELDMKMHLLAQAGDFKSAAKIRDKLGSAQLDDEGSVLQANAEFYAAYTKKDLKRMKALWLPASYVQCIMPYDKRSHGYTEVCKSFQRLFEPNQKKRSSITPEDIKVNILGATAIVSCTEQVVLQKRPIKVTLATNIFRKVENKWLLLHRHCSHIGENMSPLGGDDSEGMELALGENTMAAVRMQQFQQLMRAAKNIGGSQIIIKPANMSEYDDDDDDDDEDDDDVGPFGITGIVDGAHDEHEEDGSDEELFVEEQEQAAMERSRRATLRALRKLRADNRISERAHVYLIQDMLRHPGESIPERAHELLLDGEDSDCPAAWDEFTALMIAEMPGESKRRKLRPGRALKMLKPRRRQHGTVPQASQDTGPSN